MTKFIACHGSFLQSRAGLLVMLNSGDGIILDPVISRLMQMHANHYMNYRELSRKGGGIKLGEAIVHQARKPTTGLSMSTHRDADYIASLIVIAHYADTLKPSALKQSCQSLEPRLFELMRYKNLRNVAIYTNNLINPNTLPILENKKPKTEQKQSMAEQIWQILCENLQIPRLTFEVYFHPDIHIADMHFEPTPANNTSPN